MITSVALTVSKRVNAIRDCFEGINVETAVRLVHDREAWVSSALKHFVHATRGSAIHLTRGQVFTHPNELRFLKELQEIVGVELLITRA